MRWYIQDIWINLQSFWKKFCQTEIISIIFNLLYVSEPWKNPIVQALAQIWPTFTLPLHSYTCCCWSYLPRTQLTPWSNTQDYSLHLTDIAIWWSCALYDMVQTGLPSMRYERSRNGPKQISHIIGRPSFYFYPKHLRPSFYFYPKHLHAEKTILSCLQMSLYLAFNKSIKRIKVSSVIQYCVLCFVFCCISFIKNMQR